MASSAEHLCLVLNSCRDFLPQAYTSAEELLVLAGSSLAHQGGDALSHHFKDKLLCCVCDFGGRKVVFRLFMLWRRDSS